MARRRAHRSGLLDDSATGPRESLLDVMEEARRLSSEMGSNRGTFTYVDTPTAADADRAASRQ